MATIDISRVKAQLDDILRLAEEGEAMVMTRDDEPAFTIVPSPKRFPHTLKPLDCRRPR